jgi:hypothetical protein
MHLSFLVDGLTHYVDLAVDALLSGGIYHLKDYSVGSYSVLPGTAANELWALLQPIYNTSVPAMGYQLQEKIGVSWVTVASGTATGGNGTDSSPTTTAGIVSFTFKDASYKRMNFTLPETAVGAPHKTFYATMATPFLEIVQSFIGTGTPPYVGRWAVSRGGYRPNRAIAWTSDLSRRIRKMRHLA